MNTFFTKDVKEEGGYTNNKLRVGRIVALSVAALGLLIAFVLFILSFTVVQTGHSGLVLEWGAVKGQPLEPGIHFINPISQTVKNINLQVQTLAVDRSETYSKDLQQVNIQSTVNWAVKADSVGRFYTEYNSDLSKILQPRLDASIKQVVAQYSAEEILQQRSKIQSEIYDAFTASAPDVIYVSNYSLVDEAFTAEYEKAIEAKQIAQQNAEKANNDLTRIKVEAQQRIEQSKGEAEAIKIQAEAVRQQGGESYVQLQAIQKWNGQLPTYMMGNTTPFVNITK